MKLQKLLPPLLSIRHLKTSRQYNKADLRLRYWFQWSDRTNLGAIVVRLSLFDKVGIKVTEASVKLPKVKITGSVPATETSPAKPIYDSSVFIQLDDIDRENLPVSFSYYVVTGVFKKSAVVEGEMNGQFEDLSKHG